MEQARNVKYGVMFWTDIDHPSQDVINQRTAGNALLLFYTLTQKCNFGRYFGRGKHVLREIKYIHDIDYHSLPAIQQAVVCLSSIYMKISLLTQKNVYIKKMKLKHFQASLKKLYKRYSSRENDPNGKY